jgi:tripartite-type tricarboxylate transporter receptor subunit TctC
MKGLACSRWRRPVFISILVLLMGGAVPESWAARDTYPNKPIQIIICYQPGDTDMNLRPFTEKMAEYLGQPISFVYKPGGGGALGASFVVKAKPDGYTLIGTSPGPVLLSPISKEDLDYTLEDFVPIARLATHPIGISVKADSPWKTVNDLVEAAKQSPGKLTFASTGTYGSGHLPVEMFIQTAKIKMTHVPCPGSAPAITALLGGHVNVASTAMSPLTPHLNSGTLRLLAIFDKNRSAHFPNTPTFSELGFPVVFPYWYGLMAPKGTSKEIAGKVFSAAQKAATEQKKFIEDRLKQLGSDLALASGEEWAKENREMSEVFKKIIKDIQVQEKTSK